MDLSSPLIIVRPSGIWNSRSPLNDYIQQDRAISKSAATQTIALYVLRQRLEKESNKQRVGQQLFEGVTKHGKAAAAKAWLQYRRSHGRDAGGKTSQPTVQNLWSDSRLAIADVQEFAVLRVSSMFESYAQCWALNYLLAHIESGGSLTKLQGDLARAFLPTVSKGHVPAWPKLLNAFPILKEKLSALPHVFNHPTTRKPVSEPLSETLNAYAAIKFWRAYRNQVVHLSRLTTRAFSAKYSKFFHEAMACFGHIGDLDPGRPLPRHDDLFASMTAVHYRAATLMNEMLERQSSCRRGHPEAPGPKNTIHWPEAPRSPLLLLPGDHNLSVDWVNDAAFRASECSRRGWPLDVQQSFEVDALQSASRGTSS